MKNFVLWFKSSRLLVLAVFVSLVSVAGARADTWRGTAPFCAGKCNKGEIQKGVSDSGDGGYCVTGHKALCGTASPLCKITQTNFDCFGVVEVCDNGSSEPPSQAWHSCGKYVCGACFGFSVESLTTPAFGPATCKEGFVWRDAVKDDTVCVTPATRSQATADNVSAASHKAPHGGASGPDTCIQGLVWRGVDPSDHVCVTPQVRAAVEADNKQAAERRATSAAPSIPDTCKEGFVWREAIKNDHVCVTSAARSEAAADNAQAASRRSSNGGPSGPDSCKAGFVWRVVVPSDHVCVTPQVRDAALADAIAAAGRRAGK